MKTPVTFADLKHTGHSCNAVPLGISLVAAYVLECLGERITVDLFKSPSEFAHRLELDMPKVACFANYIWNVELSYQFASRIKAAAPGTVIVFGGPNYPTEVQEQQVFLRSYPAIDFYIQKDGEQPLAMLIETLFEYDFDIEGLKVAGRDLPDCHYLRNQDLVRGTSPPPMMDLDSIPSPYLSGLCDKFLSAEFVPLVQTARGCPFECTYCQEGQEHFSGLRRFSVDRVTREIEYIAQRAKVPNLAISDSNFGMYKEDLETCHSIADTQKRFGWPEYFIGIQGKNRKDRVLEAASIVTGSYLNAAVQSTDPQVLENVKRQNVSLSSMIDVAKSKESSESNSFSEVILCLPGDSKDAHFKSMLGLIDMGMNVVRSHQFVLLPGAEASSPDSRRRFGMATRFRIVPQTSSPYQMLGQTFTAPEIDEICVANSTMTFEDYLQCRLFDLTVEAFYNDSVFYELIGLLRRRDISVSSFILRVHERTQSDVAMAPLYEGFLRETKAVWHTREELKESLEQPGVLQRIQAGEFGFNEQLTYRAVATFRHMRELHSVAFGTAREMLAQKGCEVEGELAYLDELLEYSLLRKENLLATEQASRECFHYDFTRLAATHFQVDPETFRQPAGVDLEFSHTDEQRQLISKYISMYGTSDYGLGCILSNASHVDKLYRQVTPIMP